MNNIVMRYFIKSCWTEKVHDEQNIKMLNKDKDLTLHLHTLASRSSPYFLAVWIAGPSLSLGDDGSSQSVRVWSQVTPSQRSVVRVVAQHCIP